MVLGILGLTLYALTVGDGRFAERGDPNPGRLVGTLDVAGYFVGVSAAGLAVGSLVYVVICARPNDDGFIDATVYRAQRTYMHAISGAALIGWIMVVITAADTAGIPLGRLLETTYFFEAIGISEKAIAWLVLAIFATVAALIARFALSWIVHVILLIPTGIAAVSVAMVGNAGQGPNHDYNTGLAIFFALGLAGSLGLRISAVAAPELGSAEHRRIVDRRRLWVTAISDGTALASGLVLMMFLLPARFVFTSPYGLAAVVMVLLLVGVLVSSIRALRSQNPRATWIDVAAAIAMLGVIACWSVTETRVAPGLLTHPFTAWDVFLGYELPGPPTFTRLLTFWRFDFFIGGLGIVAAVLYGIGVRRLRQRGDAWSAGRTTSWMLGCLMLVAAVGSGMRSYGSAMFSVHMAEHMVLNMFVPVLLVLGAPATLALRTIPAAGADAPPGPREWIMRLLHSRVTKWLSNPLVGLAVFVLSLYVVYFSPIFGTFVRYHWGHVLLTIHFLVVGYMFFWVIIGVDPGPRRIPYLARIALLFAVMPFHAFFGIALMTMGNVIGDRFYSELSLPWVTSRLDDQWLGGAIAWGVSEVPVLIVVIAIVAQWAKSDRRAGKRGDRHAETYEDTELDDYNKMLDALAKSRR